MVWLCEISINRKYTSFEKYYGALDFYQSWKNFTLKCNMTSIKGHENLALAVSNSSTQAASPVIHQQIMSTTFTTKNLGKKIFIGIDIAILLTASLIIALIEFGLFPQHQQGFYCNDPKISFKYDGETISTAAIILSIFVPFFILWVLELIFDCNELDAAEKLKKALFRATLLFRNFAIGAIAHLLLIELLKVLFGEPRPHFLDSCKPNTGFNCTDGAFISTYECTNRIDSHMFVSDSSKSFPSGHSSLGTFEAIFLIWYLQCRTPELKSRLILPLIQTLFVFWACVCGGTRIIDNRHHWWDVVAGAIIGFTFASLTCLFICKNFKNENDDLTPTVNSNHQNGSCQRNTSVKRLLSDGNCTDDVTLNNISPA